ncbi:MAG TPA: LysM peptidoglycan-binding domain-containing protein [Anaerolineaceae bacterium]|nr:LysM peptidoglycan-binding domain-containing protein [Anaerolineaceae bacterium]
MNHKPLFPALVLLVLILLVAMLAVPAQAGPGAQIYYYTPTPGLDGRIIYMIKDEDTCIGISLSNNISIDQLRLLNPSLNADCTLIPGQPLLLGVVTPEPTSSGPTPTPTLALPTPTPPKGTGQVCVYLYDDINGNAMPETGELPLAGGQVVLADLSGKTSLSGITLASAVEPFCFEDVDEGSYILNIGIPDGYNATTLTVYELTVHAGDESLIEFGAQINSQGGVPNNQGEKRSPILGILGAVVLLGGIGLAIYASRMKR